MKKKKAVKKPVLLSRILSKVLVLTIIILICLIVLKGNSDIRNFVYKNVFQNNMSLAKINEIYEKHFGSSLPLNNTNKKTELVSNVKIEYSQKAKYKDGVKLTVKDSYLVSSMDSGLVIFTGKKDDYGNTIIIQRPDGVEVWYANIKNINVSLYDYIKKGDNIGEVDGTNLYLVFVKEGKILDYQKYI